jgi:hypothetical protein
LLYDNPPRSWVEQGEKTMRINIKNQDKIRALLDEVNGRAQAHTVQWAQAFFVANDAEKKLENSGVAEKDRKGVTVVYEPAGPGKAYARKGRCVATTQITLERGAACWFITGAMKVEKWADSPERFDLRISEDQAQIIREKAMAGYIVR